MKQAQLKSKNTIYGMIGLVALFVMGAIVGFILNGSDRTNDSLMTRKQCDDLSEQIIFAAKNNRPDLIAQLNKVFSENCNNRDFRMDAKPVQVKPEIKNNKLPDSTCEAIEQLLRNELYDEHNPDWQAHRDNANVYTRLVKNGCEKNRVMYQKMAAREMDIAKALGMYDEVIDIKIVDNNKPTCEQIENLLLAKVNQDYDKDDARWRVERAQIYANLSERGCAINSAKYKALAKQELDIARALTDDSLEYTNEQQEAVKMVETYKRLQMQAEAAQMIEKAKKLANPAIDFIIQLEKIIEE